jgi:von Willebrand factor type A domain
MKRVFVILSVVLLAAACGPTNSNVGDWQDGATQGDAGVQGDAGNTGLDAFVYPDASDGGSNVCDEQDFVIDIVPVRLMILQDLSGSMIGDKWTETKAALSSILTTWNGVEIEFGYDIFPDGTQADTGGWWCGTTDPVQIDCDINHQADIIAHQNTVDPDLGYGLTPLWCGMNNFNSPTYAPLFTDSSVESYLVVVSDGQDSCGTTCPHGGGSVTEAELRQVTQLLLAAGIKTVVIGFGTGVDPDQLDAIASEGGTPWSTYFTASDQLSLENAFDQIAASVISCTYDIDEPSAEANPDEVNFYFDDVVVAYDDGCTTGEGWTWVDAGHTQVEFCPQACNDLKAGNIAEISARFGCPTVIVE